MQATTPKYPATPKQIAFIATLQGERNLPVGVPENLSKKDASALISALVDMPKPKKDAAPALSLVEMAAQITGKPVPVEQIKPAATITIAFTAGELGAITGAFFVEEAEIGEHTTDGETAMAKITAALAAPKAGA